MKLKFAASKLVLWVLTTQPLWFPTEATTPMPCATRTWSLKKTNLSHSRRLSLPTSSGPCHLRFRLLGFLFMMRLMLMIMMAGGSARFLGSEAPITTMSSLTLMGLRFYIHSLAWGLIFKPMASEFQRKGLILLMVPVFWSLIWWVLLGFILGEFL